MFETNLTWRGDGAARKAGDIAVPTLFPRLGKHMQNTEEKNCVQGELNTRNVREGSSGPGHRWLPVIGNKEAARSKKLACTKTARSQKPEKASP